mmetsp:Transcript_39262/g.113484  ORF Transcript_39262/g.113484 Transcript_39262/m.113484 type:complete len:210 (+) Transcript_39262:485-1114(+)
MPGVRHDSGHHRRRHSPRYNCRTLDRRHADGAPRRDGREGAGRRRRRRRRDRRLRRGTAGVVAPLLVDEAGARVPVLVVLGLSPLALSAPGQVQAKPQQQGRQDQEPGDQGPLEAVPALLGDPGRRRPHRDAAARGHLGHCGRLSVALDAAIICISRGHGVEVALRDEHQLTLASAARTVDARLDAVLLEVPGAVEVHLPARGDKVSDR